MTRNSPRLEDAGRKLDALTTAGVDAPPACDGDDMFIADKETLLPPELARLRMVCARCPLFDLCGDYARTARPDAGFWAGVAYGKKAHPTERTA